jgi:nucleotide-binding universal stress UspA family protein
MNAHHSDTDSQLRRFTMGKKILVAVGDCTHSRHAVRYAAKISSAEKDVRYTLFHVQPLVPRIFSEAAEADPDVRAEVDALVHENTQTARCTAGTLKEIMTGGGIPESRVEVVTQPMQLGMAKDILQRAEQGPCDAIVMARRALTPSRDFFIGTTAAKVVEHALRTPVWIVAGETVSMKMMLAVDGSENSLRDVDHIIDLVGSNPDLRLTLLHIQPHLRHYYTVDFEKKNPSLQKILEREDKRRMEEFCEETYHRFTTAGLKRSQIEVKTNTRTHDISTGIIQEARTGKYSTVVVGRRGERDAFFTGRIAMRLVQKITDQTLWVVP